MSFSISASGSGRAVAKEVARRVEEEKTRNSSNGPKSHQLLDAIAQLAAGAAAALPADKPVTFSANGHVDSWYGSAVVEVKTIHNFVQDEPEPAQPDASAPIVLEGDETPAPIGG